MRRLLKILKITIFSFGILFLWMIVLAFTSVPFYAYFRLGQNPDKGMQLTHPGQVVMFGGAGMPSEDNLMRLYHSAALARHFKIPVLLVHPEDSICQVEMTRLLNQDGIDDIQYMTSGTNTRSQAVELIAAYPELTEEQLLVVTSPEHVRRTVKCLNKVGFRQAYGVGAYPATVDFDLALNKQTLGGNRIVPAVENVNIRYTFFNYLKLEITCMREYIALAYYRIKGWI